MNAFAVSIPAEEVLPASGWRLFAGQVNAAALAALREDLARIYEICRAVQIANGVGDGTEGTAHHLAGYGGALDDFLNAMPLAEEIERHFDSKIILLNYGAVLNAPWLSSYTAKPHRDVRSFSPGFPLSLNMLVMLDDFTIQNGATQVLEGSHLVREAPSPETFDRNARSITGRAGDILLFDSHLVHRTGPNISQGTRRALTLCFGRPFMKPQMDWPRFISADRKSALSPLALQLLGYHARIAASLDEYYQPPENWTFKADQR